jgi:probable rRNA maturation factor
MTPEIDVAVEDESWREPIPELEALVERVVGACLAVRALPPGPPAEVSVLFADAAAVRELNAAWRKIDSPTNVLSFPGASAPGSPIRVLGDIALAFEVVRDEAEAEGKSFEHHTIHLIAHGFLHLLGLDHEIEAEAEAMEAREREILALLGVPDPYEAPLGEI